MRVDVVMPGDGMAIVGENGQGKTSFLEALAYVEQLRSVRGARDRDLVRFAELQLAGTIGAASARTMVATVAQEEPLGLEEVMTIIDEATQVIAYSHRLEDKQHELEAATQELKAANERLKELDRLKDDFISTVTHELRTPLTGLRLRLESASSQASARPAIRAIAATPASARMSRRISPSTASTDCVTRTAPTRAPASTIGTAVKAYVTASGVEWVDPE